MCTNVIHANIIPEVIGRYIICFGWQNVARVAAAAVPPLDVGVVVVVAHGTALEDWG